MQLIQIIKYISYYDSSTASKDLKYATCALSCATASSWSSITVDSIGDVGEYTSMTIDSNDVLHIAYSSAIGSGNPNLLYATCTLVVLDTLFMDHYEPKWRFDNT